MSQYDSIFGNVQSRNKIYCIETSAVTYDILPHIKDHIITVLNNQAKHAETGKFNLICFNSDVAKWCVSLVPCTGEYVTVAEEWLNHIQSMGTCNLVGAIVSALREPLRTSICAVVFQEPDEGLDDILDLFAYIGRKVQVHIRLCLLTGEITDDIQNAYEIYLQIAEETNGSFAIVKVNSENKLVIINTSRNKNMADNVISILEEESVIPRAYTSANGFSKTILEQVLPGIYRNEKTDEIYPMCNYECTNLHYQPFDFWKRITSSESYLKCMQDLRQKNVSNMKADYVSSLAASIIVGRRVLARKYNNGLYYTGVVKKQIDTDLFKVVLGPYNTPGSDFTATDYLKTKLLDLIDFDDAWKRSIMPGDRVLAPNPFVLSDGSKPFRYITGTVLDGYSSRGYSTYKEMSLTTKDNPHPAENSKTLIIEFTHPINKTEKIDNEHAIYIPEPLFQRLCLEGTMPESARKKLYGVVNYPANSMPGYPTSGSKKFPTDYTFTHMNVLKGKDLQVDFLMPPYCLPIYPVVDIMEKEDSNKNLTARNVWNTGPQKRNSHAFNKDDRRVADSNYTVKELLMKVTDQIEKYKDFNPMKVSSDKGFYQKSVLKTNSNDVLSSAKKHSSIQTQLLKKSSKSHFQSETKDILFSKNDSKDRSVVSRNISVHDRYHDELEKIRFGTNTMKEDSYSFGTETDKSVGNKNQDKIKNNGKFESILRSSKQNLTQPLTDLGELDKITEENNNNILQQRRLKVEKRLEMEKERFCSEERKRDCKENYHRVVINQRINQENIKRQKDEELIERSQSVKREMMNEIDTKVDTRPPCQIMPETFEEIERKKIEFLRKKREIRDSENDKRNEDALKYIEKMEESKKNRCDSRWWEAQKNMLKEYPDNT